MGGIKTTGIFYSGGSSGGGLTSIPVPTLPRQTYRIAMEGTLIGVTYLSSPTWSLFRISGKSLIQIPTPDLPAACTNIAISGDLIAITYSRTPYWALYRLSGTTLTNIPVPTGTFDLVTNAYAVGINADRIIVGNRGSKLYRVTGSTVVKLSDISDDQNSITRIATFGDLFSYAMAARTCPLYRITGNSASMILEKTIANSGYDVSIYGDLWSVVSSIYGSTSENTWKLFRIGDNMAEPIITPTISGESSTTTISGDLVLVGTPSSPFWSLYRVVGNDLIAIEVPVLSGTAVASGISGDVIGLAINGAPYLSLFRTNTLGLT